MNVWSKVICLSKCTFKTEKTAIHFFPLPFANSIPVAEQSLSTASIGPHYCGHRTRAVLSSDKHWDAVLEHCLALLEFCDSSTAISAVTGCSGLLVIVLDHCQALPYDSVTAYEKDFHQIWKIPEQFPKKKFTVLLSAESPQSNLIGATL